MCPAFRCDKKSAASSAPHGRTELNPQFCFAPGRTYCDTRTALIKMTSIQWHATSNLHPLSSRECQRVCHRLQHQGVLSHGTIFVVYGARGLKIGPKHFKVLWVLWRRARPRRCKPYMHMLLAGFRTKISLYGGCHRIYAHVSPQERLCVCIYRGRQNYWIGIVEELLTGLLHTSCLGFLCKCQGSDSSSGSMRGLKPVLYVQGVGVGF